MLDFGGVVHLSAAEAPSLIVVVDTEEEFDWSKTFDRSATSVRAMRKVGRFQSLAESFGVRPTYAADYPVVTQKDGIEALGPLFASERADPAVHLHPWVSPPHDEEVSAVTSYPGNLPADLEREKIDRLAEAFRAAFGARPEAYKAGRYGIGPNTAETLRALGFRVDLSLCPPFDYGDDGGPDFSACGVEPIRLGPLLLLPSTGAYIGGLRPLGHPFYRTVTSRGLRWARLPAILSRMRLFDRLRLSPEGYTLDEMIRLTRALFDRGVRLFCFTLHSPSLEAGHTPYVRTAADLEAFLDRCHRYFEFFFRDLKGTATTPLAVAHRLELVPA